MTYSNCDTEKKKENRSIELKRRMCERHLASFFFFVPRSGKKNDQKKYAINRKKWLDYSERKTRRNQLVGAVNKREERSNTYRNEKKMKIWSDKKKMMKMTWRSLSAQHNYND